MTDQERKEEDTEMLETLRTKLTKTNILRRLLNKPHLKSRSLLKQFLKSPLNPKSPKN